MLLLCQSFPPPTATMADRGACLRSPQRRRDCCVVVISETGQSSCAMPLMCVAQTLLKESGKGERRVRVLIGLASRMLFSLYPHEVKSGEQSEQTMGLDM